MVTHHSTDPFHVMLTGIEIVISPFRCRDTPVPQLSTLALLSGVFFSLTSGACMHLYGRET
jgi:hypothetical protein